MRAELRKLTILLMVLWPGLVFASRQLTAVFAAVDSSPFRLAAPSWAWSSWLLWTIFTPYVVLLVDRYPPTGSHARRNLLIQLSGVLGAVAAYMSLFAVIRKVAADVPLIQFYVTVPLAFRYGVLKYSVIAAAVWVLQLQRKTRLSALRRSRLERELAASRVDNLVVALDGKWIFRTLDDAEARLADDRSGAMARIFALSQHLREKLRHRLSTGAVAASSAGPPAVTWQASRIAVMMFVAFSCYTTFLYTTYDYLTDSEIDVRSEATMLLAYAVATALWPLVAWACRRYRVAGRSWKRNAGIVGIACLTHASLVEVILAGLRMIDAGRPPGETFTPVLLLSLLGAYLVHSEEFGRLELAEQLRTQELARMVSDARLRSLRTQIAPHFLFNTLNSILSLIARDAESARRMLQRLRRILQVTFVCDTRQEVALREELDLTVSYIEIERIRFRDALDVDIDIDAALLEESVPAFLLQPLVENAVRHGALASLNRGTIRLSARQRGGMMELAVENDCELVDPSGWREGIGLSNIRARLDHLYGTSHLLEVEMAHEGKVSVRIRLPLMQHAAARIAV